MTDAVKRIPDIPLVAGGKQRIYFNNYDANGNIADISSTVGVYVSIWRYGDSSGSAILKKTGTKTGSAVPYQFYIDFATNDTKDLYGAYQFQTILIDSTGNEIRNNTGRFIFDPRIP